MTHLVLSLFPGIGLLDMAFEEHGFCVVRGPDQLWGGDIRSFNPPAGRFDGVIGGPPCQHWSNLSHLCRLLGYTVAPDLIPEYERCVSEAQPAWFLMENVETAPEPRIDDYAVCSFILNNRWLGENQNRRRRFSFGVRGSGVAPDLSRYMDFVLFESSQFEHAVVARGGTTASRLNQHLSRRSALPPNVKNAASVRKNARLQGLPENFLDDAPFTVAGKLKVIGNGVPLPMGRAVAGAIKQALTKEA